MKVLFGIIVGAVGMCVGAYHYCWAEIQTPTTNKVVEEIPSKSVRAAEIQTPTAVDVVQQDCSAWDAYPIDDDLGRKLSQALRQFELQANCESGCQECLRTKKLEAKFFGEIMVLDNHGQKLDDRMSTTFITRAWINGNREAVQDAVVNRRVQIIQVMEMFPPDSCYLVDWKWDDDLPPLYDTLQRDMEQILREYDLEVGCQKCLQVQKVRERWKSKVKYLQADSLGFAHRARVEIGPFVGAVVKLDARAEPRVRDSGSPEEYLMEYGQRTYWLKGIGRKQIRRPAYILVGKKYFPTKRMRCGKWIVDEWYNSVGIHKITGSQTYVDENGRLHNVYIIEPYVPTDHEIKIMMNNSNRIPDKTELENALQRHHKAVQSALEP